MALVYALAAVAWIVVSDGLLARLGDLHTMAWFGLIKGLLFVGVTTGVLHFLLAHLLRRLDRAQAALGEQEERWRMALDGVGDGVWDWRVQTGEVYYSPQLVAMLGCTAETFRPRIEEWEGRLHPEDRAGVDRALDDYFAGRRATYEAEYRLRGCDGVYRWILDRGTVIERDPAGRPLRMVGTHKDISRRRRLEREIEEQAVRYRMLFEENPHPMWIYDVESLRFLAVNDCAVQKYGYSREQFLGLTLFDLRSSAEAERLRRNLADPTADILQASGPWRHRLADGTEILVEIVSHEISWQDRRARMVVAHDVTAQAVALEARRESEEKFSAIFHSANDAIFTADEHYVLTAANARGLELFRAKREQMIGRRIVDFFPARQPDGSSSIFRAREILERVWHERFPPFEWTHRRPDGSTFPSESTISSVNLHGRRSLIVVVRDLTERLKTTEQLRLLDAALRAAPAGLVITDATGRIEWVNPAFTRLTGYEPAEVIGANPRLLRSGAHSPEFYRQMWETIGRGEVWTGELQNRRRDGTTYHEHMTIAPVRAPGGEITHYVAIKEDITNARQLEQQLARAQRLESVGMLASGIAHDLNNVLTPILLSTELLKTGTMQPQAVARLDLVAQAAQRGASIVKQVLTFARGVDGERAAVQPRYLMKEVAQLAGETFPREIEVRVECGRDLPTIVGDLTQLHQVLLNLAVNARDAMPRGGRLTFAAHVAEIDEARARRTPQLASGTYVELAVGDTGTGITDDVLDHLFEPFFTTKPRGKGTGLGLSTVYGIVRSHGGGVEIDTRVGRGTTFRVLLPVPARPPQEPAAAAVPVAIRGAGRLVLVVDDEEPIRVVAEQVLRRHGFAVVVAVDGVQALQLFRLRPGDYAAAIIDMMMPRMNGAALMRELRALAPGLAIISSSGFMATATDDGEPLDLEALGVRTLLPKPYAESELLEAMREALEPAPPLGAGGKKKV